MSCNEEERTLDVTSNMLEVVPVGRSEDPEDVTGVLRLFLRALGIERENTWAESHERGARRGRERRDIEDGG